MKNVQIAGFIILLLINSTASAGQWMVGGSLGMAWGEADGSELNKDLVGRGINATINNVDNNRVMAQIFAGYEYISRWGVELGYVDLGDVSASINGTVTGIEDYFAVGQDIYPQTATGWQLSSIYRYPVSGSLQLTGRVGVFSWTTDYTLQTNTASQDVSEDGTDIVYGVGLESANWIKQGGVVSQFNLDRYSINGEDINVLTIGVSYRF